MALWLTNFQIEMFPETFFIADGLSQYLRFYRQTIYIVSSWLARLRLL